MRLLIYLLILAAIPSCVSSKKDRVLETSFGQLQNELQNSNNLVAECSKNNLMLEQKLLSADHQNQMKDQKMEFFKKEHFFKDDKIRDIENNLTFVKTSNDELTKRIDDLSTTNKLNVDIMKKLLEDAEVQHLKVLNLSLALQKQDSLNIHLVKRTKKNISDQKIKKSLEKLGFVFY